MRPFTTRIAALAIASRSLSRTSALSLDHARLHSATATGISERPKQHTLD
jgi:hypothetical protein